MSPQTRLQSLTEDLVQPWHESYLPVLYLLSLLVPDPEGLAVMLDAADVGVWPQENVLELRLLLVDLLYGLLLVVLLCSLCSHQVCPRTFCLSFSLKLYRFFWTAN